MVRRQDNDKTEGATSGQNHEAAITARKMDVIPNSQWQEWFTNEQTTSRLGRRGLKKVVSPGE